MPEPEAATETFYCEWCGDPFDHQFGPGPKPRFCRPSHRQRAYEAKRVASGTVQMDGMVGSGAEVARLRKEMEDVARSLADLADRIYEKIGRSPAK